MPRFRAPRLQRGIMFDTFDLVAGTTGGLAPHGKNYRASRLHRLAGGASGRHGSRPPAAASGVGGLVIVDIREPRLYEAGHIPGSISIPFSPMSDWAVSDDELLMELPPDEDLFALLGDWGIGPDSTVVLVGTVEPRPAPPYALSDAPRVAATLFHAGVADVGDPGRRLSPVGGGRKAGHDARSQPSAPRRYTGAADQEMFVSTEYVKAHLGRSRARRWPGRRPVLRRHSLPLRGGRRPHPHRSVAAGALDVGRRRHLQAGRDTPGHGRRRPRTGQRPGRSSPTAGSAGTPAPGGSCSPRSSAIANVKIYDGAAEAWVKGDSMVSYTW